MDSVGNVLAGIIFLPRVAACKTFGGWFFLFSTESAMKWGSTDDPYSDGLRSSVTLLLTDFIPYTDKINPSVKLFNGVAHCFEEYRKNDI